MCLPGPEGLSAAVRSQSESKIALFSTSAFQIMKPLIVGVIKRFIGHVSEYLTSRRHG
ncbi:hypothetical protein MA6G0728R_4986 [Mycobacteroides abscessus 6G-0728-R]|uniref:Uncharacterized protein n=1 Tax=Mycobacteroides abscessus 1948 TaxID=1299323 RepID=A0A829QLG4_9MYCO|nr:hypothetical protein MA6G0125S_5054 [Mycobacteroides abscessus 6G-0125-S]EIU40253.1 hypothetical protein MA6G0125R_4015 [Mycobacteroides abscessus 6G-0125-R]EIU52512.1 hypothetical protein MA6G1108_4984 [Mycobacteroides abscessus 6G-1108]EIU54515.1 hypothetical protein MA6G0728S_4744 [Mycobacteroides abscessus 6G-0728-S]EIU90077.1 hypothetical protein MA6G0212_5041 [Mycobacteroides abscessus 6G-0212]EIU96170.1 hypothetical protein MA6G0728R_4986 [Mycobacteroides abscessus 6G-0728-R]EIV2096